MTRRHLNRLDSLKWLAAAAILAPWLANTAQAAQPPITVYSTQASKVIISFPAGGATDYAGRASGIALSQLWSQPAVFDNRVGASSAIGTDWLPHLTMEWFLSQAKVRMTHVPYRGIPQALSDLILGRVDVMMGSIVSALPLIEGGKLRLLAAFSSYVGSRMPGVSSIASFGNSGFAAGHQYGLFVPKGTPGAVIKKIETNVEKASADSRRGAVIAKATDGRAE